MHVIWKDFLLLEPIEMRGRSYHIAYYQRKIAVNVTVQSYQLWQLSRDSVLMVSKISGSTANLMVLRSIDFLRVNFVVLAQISFTLEGKRSAVKRFY